MLRFTFTYFSNLQITFHNLNTVDNYFCRTPLNALINIITTTSIPQMVYIQLNPTKSDIGPIKLPPNETPKSAQAINNPSSIFRPALGKTKLKYDVSVGYTKACVAPINIPLL